MVNNNLIKGDIYVKETVKFFGIRVAVFIDYNFPFLNELTSIINLIIIQV